MEFESPRVHKILTPEAEASGVFDFVGLVEIFATHSFACYSYPMKKYVLSVVINARLSVFREMNF